MGHVLFDFCAGIGMTVTSTHKPDLGQVVILIMLGEEQVAEVTGTARDYNSQTGVAQEAAWNALTVWLKTKLAV